MTQGVFEIMRMAASQPVDAAKAAYLKQRGDNAAIRTILQGCFHPAIQFALPDDLPPYSEGDPVSVETRLYSMIKRFDIFVHGGRPVASQAKREMIFIETLESIHPLDAKIVVNMVQKKDPYPGITIEVAREAFPELIPPAEEVEALKETIVKPELELKVEKVNAPQFNIAPNADLMPEGQSQQLVGLVEEAEKALTPLGEALQTDPTLFAAYNLIINETKIGNNTIQKPMAITYAKATKILQRLEELGVVGKKGVGGKRIVNANVI
tara:strand:- start:9536 stop:10336 length:801 start_codon:yes stop_codon:yes gene_type:complete